MKPHILALTSLATIIATTAPSLATIVDNGLVVRDTGPSSFTIPYRGLSGPRDFWCAAGDYVIRDLGLRGNTRIYRTSPNPRRSGEGVSFSLSAQGSQPSGLAVIGGGHGIRALHAYSLCNVSRD